MRPPAVLARVQEPASLSAGDVHLWWWSDDGSARPQDRRQRVDQRLRQALSHYTPSVEPLEFDRESKGRPFLRNSGAPDFNLSDTSGGTLLAVSSRGRVGVDLERADRNLPALRLARRWFSPEETAALSLRPVADQASDFIRLWTAKEASCKATGTGIFGHLDRWRFALGGDDPVAIRPLPAEAGCIDEWRFVRISPATGFTAVLALWAVQLNGIRLIEADAAG